MVDANLLNQSSQISVGMQEYIGTIANVGEDFILLETTAGSIIIVNEHIRQVSFRKAANSPSTERWYQTLDKKKLGSCFHDASLAFQNKVITLEGGGMGTTSGQVVSVKEDYLVLSVVPDGILFLPLHHILTVGVLDEVSQPEFTSWTEELAVGVHDENNFINLLKSYINTAVTLGLHSPEEVTGILRDVKDLYAEVVTSPIESRWVLLKHVKNFTTFSTQRGDRHAIPISEQYGRENDTTRTRRTRKS